MITRDKPSLLKSLLSRSGLVLSGFLVVAGYFLWAEHNAHIVAYLPLLLVFGLCLGMHFFMHGGHSGHGDGGTKAGSDNDGPGDDDRKMP